jgi:hypothetical protein
VLVLVLVLSSVEHGRRLGKSGSEKAENHHRPD